MIDFVGSLLEDIYSIMQYFTILETPWTFSSSGSQFQREWLSVTWSNILKNKLQINIFKVTMISVWKYQQFSPYQYVVKVGTFILNSTAILPSF